MSPLRAGVLSLAVSSLAGCGSVTTLHGARILEAGERETHVAINVSDAVNPVLGQSYLPFPRLDYQSRRSIAPDMDAGIALLGGTPAVDLRIRAARTERLDLALDPTLAGIYVPVDLTPGGEGSSGIRGLAYMEVYTPLIAQYDLGRGMSISVGLRPGLRTLVLDASKRGAQTTDDVATVEMLLGGGLRFERRGSRGGWAVHADLLTRPWRAAPVGASFSVDWLLLRRARSRQLRKQIKAQVR